jgi:cell shape-determining protein MreD
VSWLLLAFWLLAACTLQAVVPPVSLAAPSPVPFLAVAVFHAANDKPPAHFVVAAFVAGLFADALSLVPPGLGTFAYLAGGTSFLLLRSRGSRADGPLALFFRGALAGAVLFAVLALLLALKGQLPALGAKAVAGRLAMSALLSALLTPLQFACMDASERLLSTRTPGRKPDA